MAYTVKQVAALSRVSVRTLHFYHHIGLLTPASIAPNGYRFYEEPQLLTLQQILFYRELGFDLRRIKQILSRPRFHKATALRSHRKLLLEKIAHTQNLLHTIDKTLTHLKGKKKMKSEKLEELEELFVGFTVPPDGDRFGEHLKLGGPAGEPIDCKISAKDTHNALALFEFNCYSGGPKHLHRDQDEWIYVLEGNYELHLARKQLQLRPGESIFIPRNTPHVWASANPTLGKVLNAYQPANTIEDFFRHLASYDGNPPVHEALGLDGLRQLFHTYGMQLLGPPLGWTTTPPFHPLPKK